MLLAVRRETVCSIAKAKSVRHAAADDLGEQRNPSRRGNIFIELNQILTTEILGGVA
jgi:hypothetical protein